MVRSTILILVIGVISIFTFQFTAIGETTSSDVSEKSHQTWETFKAYVIDQKHEAVGHGKDLLKKADARIDEMKGKAAKAAMIM